MNRLDFIQKMHENFELSDTDLKQLINKSIDTNLIDGFSRGHRNLIICMEEMSELIKEISKHLRDKGDKYDLLQELADVQLAIYYIQNICEISSEDLHKAMSIKMKRVGDVLDTNTQYM